MKRFRLFCSCVALCGGLFYAGLAVEYGPALDTTTVTMGSSFNSGWRAGYIAGWKHVKGQNSIDPIVPIPPIPPTDRDNYSGGYGLGFVRGMNDAR